MNILWHAALLIALALGVYANTFDSAFHFDDLTNIVNNPLVHDLRSFLPGSGAAEADKLGTFGRRTVGFFTFALNYRVHGNEVEGYHIINICIHIVNILLVYILTALAFRTPLLRTTAAAGRSGTAALLAAALFAAHPVQTQAVTYVVQRFTSLATLWYLGSLVLYLQSRLMEGRTGRWVLYGLSLLLCVLGMKTKEIVFTLPLMMALWEAVLFEGPWKRRAARLLPFVAPMVIVPLGAMMYYEAGTSGGLTVFNIPRHQYLFTEARVLVTYLRLLVLPMGQNFDYDYPIYTSLGSLPVITSAGLLASLLIYGVYLVRRGRGGGGAVAMCAGLGILWFFLSLSVESTLVPLHPINEHRLYLPMAGVSLGVGTAASLYMGRLSGRGRRVFLAACMALVLVLGVLAHERNTVWSTEITLWQDVVEKAPGRVQGHIGLGSAYYKYGQRDNARRTYERAANLFFPFLREFRTISAQEHQRRLAMGGPYARLAKDYTILQFNLGLLDAVSGHPEAAVPRFQDAIRAKPDYADARFHLARAYYQMARYEDAQQAVLEALEHSPNDRRLWELLNRIETAAKGSGGS